MRTSRMASRMFDSVILPRPESFLSDSEMPDVSDSNMLVCVWFVGEFDRTGYRACSYIGVYWVDCVGGV